MITDEVIKFFEDQYRKPAPAWHIATWIYFVLAGPVLLGFICRALYVYEPASAWALSATAALFCALNLYLMLMFALDLYATRFAAGHMARMLRDGRNDIAWLYIETIASYYLPEPEPVLHFHFTDRRVGRVTAPLETVTRLMNYFDARFPDICLGYERKLAWRYFWQPGSLKTNVVRHRMARKTVYTIVSADN